MPARIPSETVTAADFVRARGNAAAPVERTPFAEHDALSFINPMRPPGTVRVRLSLAGATRIELVASSGHTGLRLLDGRLCEGWHTLVLPEGIRPGTYFVRMETPSGRTTAMMVVTR